MKLYLEGHDYKYAAEQIMMAILPGARPEYSGEPPCEGEDWARVSLIREEGSAVAETRLFYGGTEAFGSAEAEMSLLTDEISTNRELSKIIKLSFYNAALKVLPEAPVWGALTGIRPGTLMTRIIESGVTGDDAVAEMQKTYFLNEDRARLCLETATAALNIKNQIQKKDIAIYVGIPFCPTRCAYCSFVSQSVEKSMDLIGPYLNALYKELSATASLVEKLGLRVIAVYIGGGTPTTLSASQIEELIKRLYEEFDLSAVREFCIEAGRPDTITEEKLRAMCGKVTRISINPQSMSEKVLRAIGRKHSADDIRASYALSREVLDVDVNMDLIAGLPGDTPESFSDTVKEIISLDPENITIHTLALKRGTQITMEDISCPGKEAVRQMLDEAAARLYEAGYGPYYLYRQKFMSGGFENVGWAKKNKDSLYNILIMEELCTILAMGGGGSTKLVDAASGKIERIFDPKYPKEYIEGIDRIIEDKKRIEEFYGK